MKYDMKEYTLGQACSRLSSGKNIPASQVYEKSLYPVYGGNGLRGYTDHSNFSGECAIIGRQGAFCGNVRFFSGEAYMTEHAVVTCAKKEHNTRYLAYLLSMMNLGRLSGQSAQPGLSVKTLSMQKVFLPSKEIQDRVASILAAIEEKIITNVAINDNLLQQLQSVYQQLFSHISRDNGEAVLSDICSYSQRRVSVASLTPESYYSTENMLPDKAGAVSASSLPTIVQTTGCAPGDVLISNIRPYFKKIVYCRSECGCSTDVLCFVPNEPNLSPYLFSTLYDDHFFDYMVAGSKGTKMPRGDKQQIMAYPIVKPSGTQLERFNTLAVPILAKVESNNQENKGLNSLRDSLLPKLMSGEIDVSSIAV